LKWHNAILLTRRHIYLMECVNPYLDYINRHVCQFQT